MQLLVLNVCFVKITSDFGGPQLSATISSAIPFSFIRIAYNIQTKRTVCTFFTQIKNCVDKLFPAAIKAVLYHMVAESRKQWSDDATSKV